MVMCRYFDGGTFVYYGFELDCEANPDELLEGMDAADAALSSFVAQGTYGYSGASREGSVSVRLFLVPFVHERWKTLSEQHIDFNGALSVSFVTGRHKS